MDIENKTFNIECPNCKKKITLTFHTVKCPKCGITYDEKEVKQAFYNYESTVENSKLYKFGQYMEKSGEGMNQAGKTIGQLGCFIFFLPLLIFLIWFITKIS
ncbi:MULTISPECIES: hypothetical protein [unclassified Enterococcus]|uniref:hypothetical protein n=1 Tax=unclassified Enterococcus TaxID=2608891 RepID=UPI001553344C|nr:MULTISPECIES: hypothetical protein [unclassified Enterococcus]MBS7577486.1 hypothetical protein [Enterococcus sp. MMGLQ5-2]MBS7585015.1 hypothetical protein [Enterococcus sp. MMGLQ5-1]NPD12871.1 hypothetical protein [Enterococcus sp. MMGLQ5-1]NPD37318.1 hypothetical protein [Enterococcus sp. MMGLQ5-2]